VWIATVTGLYWCRAGSLDKPEPTGLNIGSVRDIQEAGGWVWIGTDDGLYRLRMGSPGKPEPSALEIGPVAQIKVAGGAVWLNTRTRGLYQITGAATAWNTPIPLTKKFAEISYSNAYLPVSWEIKEYGRRTAPDAVRCRVVLY